MDKCKYCFDTEHLKPLNNFRYRDIETSKTSRINGFKCTKCGCIHSLDDDGDIVFWEFSYNPDRKKKDTIAGWATDQSVQQEKIKQKHENS